MLIRMKSTAAGPEYLYRDGCTYDVAPELGAVFVGAGYAVDLTPAAPAAPAVEVAAMSAAPETATLPRAFKRRR